MRDQYHQEMAQLASSYGKLDLVWFDGGGEQTNTAARDGNLLMPAQACVNTAS